MAELPLHYSDPLDGTRSRSGGAGRCAGAEGARGSRERKDVSTGRPRTSPQSPRMAPERNLMLRQDVYSPAMAETRDHFALVDGVRIHWADVGKPSSSTPVVLIHGLTNSLLTWSKVAPLLAADRHVIMLDLPGHGESERPNAGYALDWYAHITARWLEAVGVLKADVVGHSFGGGIAQMLLLECPDRLRRLVLVASGGLGKAVGWWLRLASLPEVVEHLGQPFMALGTRLALRGARAGVTAEDIRALCQYNSQPGSARAFARSVRDVINWRGQLRTFDQRAAEIEKLPPMLVLWGDQDRLIPVEQGRDFARSLEGAVFRAFPAAGHYLHNEQPEKFVHVVRAFLDDPTVPATRFHPA